MFLHRRCILLSTALTLFIWQLFLCQVAANRILETTPSILSANGALDITLTLEESSLNLGNDIFLTTRTYNGTLPGPTLRLLPGDSLSIQFLNTLQPQLTSEAFVHNKISAPDETNLHFHGLHVSGELPSDDTTFVIRPGESYRYLTHLPADHMPGTHWIHPHRHGSSAVQVAGGASLALIVEDPPGFLPAQLSGVDEIVLYVHPMKTNLLQESARKAGDSLMSITSPYETFLIVNGELEPEVSLPAGEWVRFRIIFAGWFEGNLDMTIPGCEMVLLAKDGIYIRDFPRPISMAEIVPGGRADVLVRCPDTDSVYTMESKGRSSGRDSSRDGDRRNGDRSNEGPRARDLREFGLMGTIRTSSVVSNTTATEELEPWTPTFPNYLKDLRNVEPSSGCSCETEFFRGGVNGEKFPEEHDQYLHETYLGAVVERVIDVDDHPYHQHVYPFQLVSGFERGYNQWGDWHDTILHRGVIRYQTTDIPGKVMLHCHRLVHEDEGMMAIEVVHDQTDDSSCVCRNRSGGVRLFGSDVSRPRAVAVTVSLLALITAVGGGVLWCYCRRGRRMESSPVM